VNEPTPSNLQPPEPTYELPSHIIQQNNAVLVYSINTCRLLFKIAEQLKKKFVT
jgi:hypothetical protein